ncbi:MAG: HDOD domain-containing protein [Planctomycetes bacterium]|nr:HDOD domain-containing protein [Planctomycetota bacterium]
MAQQVELTVSKLKTLSSLPCVAARVLQQGSQLAEIIESDPAITAKTLSVATQHGINPADEKFSIRQIIGKLPAEVVRDIVLSVKAAGIAQDDASRVLPRKLLAIHNLAVACCAKEIAETIPGRVDSQLAYMAGLLHDIGKLALDTAMPKSFAKINEQANSQNLSACEVERKNLGIDHTILGKRLAVKWRLPEKIVLAIWLHHSNTEIIVAEMPGAKIAQIVQLADCISRQCGLGQSGSYDTAESTAAIAESLKITDEQLEQIHRSLPELVEQKSKILGLDSPNPSAAYCNAVHTTATQLAQQEAKLSQENRQLAAASGHYDFIAEFLSNIDSTSNVIEIAEDFAVSWQKFYQTGPVCLYLTTGDDSQTLSAIAVENLAESKVLSLNAPAGTPAIPKAMRNEFAILNAYDHIDWLFEQIDIDFNSGYTKIIPLLSGGKAIGAIVFELRYPADVELFVEDFKVVTSIAGSILDIATAWDNQQRFAERFAQLASRPKQIQPQTEATPAVQEKIAEAPKEDNTLAALAEMAGGAAHELNNPLSVISGRAQLLAKGEKDAEKKQVLNQIQENANELAWIIDSLMTFADPPPPRTEQVDIKQILDEAAQLTAQRMTVQQLDVEITGENKNVSVDSVQIVSSIANIFTNAAESYSDGFGPIKVNIDIDKSDDFVEVRISDSGSGMNAETLLKATQPFFSVKPAGRKRGMGLAHAQRFIQLNGGSLKITSQQGSGTEVVICLPCE